MHLKQFTITLLVTYFSLGSALAYDANIKNAFDDYAKNFGKQYFSPSEKAYRFSIFAAKKVEIDAFNSENHSYTKGLNRFSDLTPAERKSFTGTTFISDNSKYGKPFQPSDANNQSSTGVSGRLLAEGDVTLDSFTPRSLDWANSGKVTPVRDQKQCGSCWAFAALATTESYFLIHKNKNYDLSEQELVDCTRNVYYGNSGCNGGLLRNTLGYVYDRGITNESSYPYTAKNGMCKTKRMTKYYIPNYYYVNPGMMSNFLGALNYGPLSIAYAVTDSFFDYRSGIYDAKAGCPEGISINHAVLAVGYDLDAIDPNLNTPTRFIRFKNQWGASWGENGYFRMNFENVDSQTGPCQLVNHSENTIVYP